MDSDVRSSYCAVNRKNASKDTVSSYKKYLAKTKAYVPETEAIPRKQAVRGSVDTYVQKQAVSIPKGAIEVTGKKTSFLL